MPRSVYEPKKRERKLGDFLPGDDYNEHGPDWSEILRAQGYKFAFARGDARYWTRPGKTFGVSASTDHVPGKFYPFSTNCYPFDSNRAYSKFAFFSLTECGGDFSKAARELARQGYGTERPEEHHVEGTPRNSTSGREITESVINEDHSEREAIQAEGCAAEQAFVGVVPDVQEPVSFIDWASDFLSAVDPPIRYLINELLPERAIVLLHGEPRTRKSWTAADMAVSLATGRPAFGLPRFSVSSPVRVLYTSQEDSAFLVRPRFKALLKGRGIDGFPENLAFAVFKGIDLDSPEWRENLIGEIQRQQIQAVIFDPIRRYSIHADEGPSEVRKITGYLRRLVNETGATVVIVHHDVKPPQNGPDNRRRGHRASGGDWFAAAECPISFETAGDACTLAYPESFKLSSDPEPFKFQLETDDPRQATTARLVGETATAAEASTLAIDEAVLAYLSGQPGASTNTITKALRKGAGVVKQSLERLFVAGKVDCVEGARKAKLWTVR
jgi:hypothetical protein